MKGCVRLAAAGTIVGRSRKQRGRSALRHPGCACALVLSRFLLIPSVTIQAVLYSLCACICVCVFLYSLFQFQPFLHHRDYAWGHKVIFLQFVSFSFICLARIIQALCTE